MTKQRCAPRNPLRAGTLVALALLGRAEIASACAAEPYLGSVCVTAAGYCPDGYLEANGQTLPVQGSYQALYALLGTTYGGSQGSSFALPDLRGRLPVHVGQGTGLSPVAQGQQRGYEKIQLSQAQLPQHNHAAAFTPATGQQPVTIPARPGSGAITATATTDVVPGGNGVDPASNVADYYLTGVSTGAAGPVTRTAPGADKSTLIGTRVTVDGSTYRPAVDAQTVNITTVTGGAVTVANSGTSSDVPILPPELGLRYCIAVEGLFPPRPN